MPQALFPTAVATRSHWVPLRGRGSASPRDRSVVADRNGDRLRGGEDAPVPTGLSVAIAVDLDSDAVPVGASRFGLRRVEWVPRRAGRVLPRRFTGRRAGTSRDATFSELPCLEGVLVGGCYRSVDAGLRQEGVGEVCGCRSCWACNQYWESTRYIISLTASTSTVGPPHSRVDLNPHIGVGGRRRDAGRHLSPVRSVSGLENEATPFWLWFPPKSQITNEPLTPVSFS